MCHETSILLCDFEWWISTSSLNKNKLTPIFRIWFVPDTILPTNLYKWCQLPQLKPQKGALDEFFCNTNLASLKLVSWNPGMCQGSTRPTEPWPLQTLLDSCQKLLGKVRPSQVILTNYPFGSTCCQTAPFSSQRDLAGVGLKAW